MSDIPQLPEHVSNDGREIWDWAAKFSEHAHRQDKMRKLQSRIRELGTKCGHCSLWMTRSCPKEVHSNKTGRSTGPHMNLPKCVKFQETQSVTNLRDGLIEELKTLEGADNGKGGE